MARVAGYQWRKTNNLNAGGVMADQVLTDAEIDAMPFGRGYSLREYALAAWLRKYGEEK